MSTLRWRIAQYLESRWWKNYLSGKDTVTYLRDKRTYWERFLDEAGYTPRRGDTALDAGCGPAGIFMLLKDEQDMTATDPLLETYERDLDIFSRRHYPEVDFRIQNLEDLDEVGKYDVVYCCNAVNHVADWEAAMDNLTVALKPGGTLVLSSDVHRRAWLKPIFRALPGDALHPQQHDGSEYRRALERRGFTVLEERTLRQESIFNYVVWVARL